MANHLSMANLDFIVTLHQRGWSQRRIAREQNIDRQTVARHLRAYAAAPKPAKAPLGSEAVPAESKPAKAPLGSAARVEARVEPLPEAAAQAASQPTDHPGQEAATGWPTG